MQTRQLLCPGCGGAAVPVGDRCGCGMMSGDPVGRPQDDPGTAPAGPAAPSRYAAKGTDPRAAWRALIERRLDHEHGPDECPWCG